MSLIVPVAFAAAEPLPVSYVTMVRRDRSRR